MRFADFKITFGATWTNFTRFRQAFGLLYGQILLKVNLKLVFNIRIFSLRPRNFPLDNPKYYLCKQLE